MTAPLTRARGDRAAQGRVASNHHAVILIRSSHVARRDRADPFILDDDAVAGTWEQTITVSGLDQPYTLHCEPEGMSIEVLPGDELQITFAAANPHEFELSWVAGGLLLCRLGDSEVTIHDKRGRDLRW